MLSIDQLFPRHLISKGRQLLVRRNARLVAERGSRRREWLWNRRRAKGIRLLKEDGMKVRSGQLLHHNFLNKFVFIPLPSLTDFFDSFPRLTLRRAFFSPSTTSPRFAVSLEHPYPDCRDCFVRFLRLSRLSLNEKIMRETCRSVPSRMWIAMIAGKAFPDVRLSRIQLHRIEIQSRTNRYRSREFGLQPRSSPIVGNYGTRKFLCEHSSN